MRTLIAAAVLAVVATAAPVTGVTTAAGTTTHRLIDPRQCC